MSCYCFDGGKTLVFKKATERVYNQSTHCWDHITSLQYWHDAKQQPTERTQTPIYITKQKRQHWRRAGSATKRPPRPGV